MLLLRQRRPGPGGRAGLLGAAEREQPGLAGPAAARRRGGVAGGRPRGRLGFAPSWLEANATAALKLRGLYAADFAAEFAGRDAYRALLDGLDVPGQLAGRDPVHQSLYLWSKAVLPSYVLTVLGDRMEMAHSVEGRVPFLDHHVVELVRVLPVSAEDPGHDGEVRAARGGPAGPDRHGVPAGRSTRS